MQRMCLQYARRNPYSLHMGEIPSSPASFPRTALGQRPTGNLGSGGGDLPRVQNKKGRPMTDAPKEIWISSNVDGLDGQWGEIKELYWQTEREYNADPIDAAIRYIRADIAEGYLMRALAASGQAYDAHEKMTSEYKRGLERAAEIARQHVFHRGEAVEKAILAATEEDND